MLLLFLGLARGKRLISPVTFVDETYFKSDRACCEYKSGVTSRSLTYCCGTSKSLNTFSLRMHEQRLVDYESERLNTFNRHKL